MSGLQAIGQILEGVGSFVASRAKGKALEAAAEVAKREAGIRAALALDAGERASARAATLAAASGGGLTGSAMTVLEDLGRQSMFNARVATYEGVSEAKARNYEAKVARRQGDFDLVTSFVKAGATFAGSAGSSAGGGGGGEAQAAAAAAGGG